MCALSIVVLNVILRKCYVLDIILGHYVIGIVIYYLSSAS